MVMLLWDSYVVMDYSKRAVDGPWSILGSNSGPSDVYVMLSPISTLVDRPGVDLVDTDLPKETKRSRGGRAES